MRYNHRLANYERRFKKPLSEFFNKFSRSNSFKEAAMRVKRWCFVATAIVTDVGNGIFVVPTETYPQDQEFFHMIEAITRALWPVAFPYDPIPGECGDLRITISRPKI